MKPWHEHYIHVDGVRTRYLEAGDGPPIVLLHAGEFGGAADLSWEHTIPALADGYRVLAPDWLGFGFTDKLHDFGSGALRRLEHMRRFIEILELGGAAYVGNSMGGLLLARAIAADSPLWDASAAVIISAGGLAPENEHRQVLLDYDCTIDAMRAVLRVLFHDARFAEDDEYVQRRYEMSIVPGAWECAAAARLRSPVAPARSDFGAPDPTPWEAIRCPTLIVAGEKDKLKLPGYARELADRTPDGRLIVYPDCGHAPNIEVADLFNADLLEFLSETYPARRRAAEAAA
jgi:pimeloyl-ACP methyl ester carboxylesterase